MACLPGVHGLFRSSSLFSHVLPHLTSPVHLGRTPPSSFSFIPPSHLQPPQDIGKKLEIVPYHLDSPSQLCGRHEIDVVVDSDDGE